MKPLLDKGKVASKDFHSKGLLLFYSSFLVVVLMLHTVDLGESTFVKTFSSGVASGSRFSGALHVKNAITAFHTASLAPPSASPSAFGGCVVYEGRPKDEPMSIDATLPDKGGSAFPLPIASGAFGWHIRYGSQPEDVPMPFDDELSSSLSTSPTIVALHPGPGQWVEDFLMSDGNAGLTSNGTQYDDSFFCSACI